MYQLSQQQLPWKVDLLSFLQGGSVSKVSILVPLKGQQQTRFYCRNGLSTQKGGL